MHTVPKILLAMLVCAGQVHASHDGTIHPHPEDDKKQQATHLHLVPDVIRHSTDRDDRATTAVKKSPAGKKAKPKKND